MVFKTFETHLAGDIRSSREAGLSKTEGVLTSPQKVEMTIQGRTESVLKFWPNNYLGLSVHPREAFAWAGRALGVIG
jgi:7-keto-8-aminopelargonate synthetase-like enzyme